jgi:Tfp pilus assembly PilM family ATPase
MARSCGIRIGPRRFELVVLDGGAKKHKITAYMAGELPREGDDPIATAAAVLREAVKQHNVPKDNVGVVIDTGLAAFRTIKVPFSDRNKIEEVLKFEVEGQLPQWNVDDLVVDFHVLESTPEGSDLLVTAVPKSDLKNVLTICEKAGIEPLEAELETSAMVNAAMAADICTKDNAQVLVHIGESSTSVVVMDGGKVREMRAIHIGALSHEFPYGGGADGDVAPPEGEEAIAAAATAAEALRDPSEIQRRLEQAIKRIRRELGRTVSAARTAHTIDAVYVCGLELPGLAGTRILDAEVRVLDVFEKDGGQPVEGFGPLVVPYGAAVRQLGGGVMRPSLRREDLRYTGAFERIELPLAVVALLVLAFLGVWFIFLKKERDLIDSDLWYWRESARNYLLGEPAKGRQGYLVYPSDKVREYVTNYDKDTDRSKFEQLRRTQLLINDEIKKLEKDLGQDAEITQPQSALVGLSLVLDVLGKEMTDANRPSLRKVQSTFAAGRQGKPDHVHVVFDVSFFAENPVVATENYENLQKELKKMPWFVEFDAKPSITLEGDKGIFLSGIAIDVDVSKAQPTKAAQ